MFLQVIVLKPQTENGYLNYISQAHPDQLSDLGIFLWIILTKINCKLTQWPTSDTLLNGENFALQQAVFSTLSSLSPQHELLVDE